MSASAIALQIRDRLQTALHFAVQGGHYPIVELLLSNAEVAMKLFEKIDKYGQSALHWATGKPSDQGKELVDLLIEKAFILPPELCKNFFLAKKNEGYTALHIAVHANSNETIKSLVRATKDSILEFISAVDQYGQTALHWAAGRGNLNASTCLCEVMKPDEINIQMTNRQQTALHFAVQGGYTDIVQLLINSGADIDLKDVNGWTAFRYGPDIIQQGQKKLSSSCWNRKPVIQLQKHWFDYSDSSSSQ